MTVTLVGLSKEGGIRAIVHVYSSRKATNLNAHTKYVPVKSMDRFMERGMYPMGVLLINTATAFESYELLGSRFSVTTCGALNRSSTITSPNLRTTFLMPAFLKDTPATLIVIIGLREVLSAFFLAFTRAFSAFVFAFASALFLFCSAFSTDVSLSLVDLDFLDVLDCVLDEAFLEEVFLEECLEALMEDIQICQVL